MKAITNSLSIHLADIPKSLHQFFLEARSLRLEGLRASDHLNTRPPANLGDGGAGGLSEPSRSDRRDRADGTGGSKGTLSSFGMSKKKRHEVALFSELVAEEMSKNGITQVCSRYVCT